MQRLFSGRFECPSCGALYKATEDAESDLICGDCDESLEPVNLAEEEKGIEADGSRDHRRRSFRV